MFHLYMKSLAISCFQIFTMKISLSLNASEIDRRNGFNVEKLSGNIVSIALKSSSVSDISIDRCIRSISLSDVLLTRCVSMLTTRKRMPFDRVVSVAISLNIYRIQKMSLSLTLPKHSNVIVIDYISM